MTITDYRPRLCAQQQELEELIALARQGKAAVELDQSRLGRLSRMDALQKQAMSQEVARRRQTELNRIKSALKRLEEDDFGFCITCGEEIEPERLELNPSLPQCSICAMG